MAASIPLPNEVFHFVKEDPGDVCQLKELKPTPPEKSAID